MKLPQLSLRDLFWLVLVAAMALGWWWNVRLVEATCHERCRQQERLAQFVINEFHRAQVNVDRLHDKVESLSDYIQWLKTPEDQRPVE